MHSLEIGHVFSNLYIDGTYGQSRYDYLITHMKHALFIYLFVFVFWLFEFWNYHKYNMSSQRKLEFCR